ncbi:MAG: hypothetical protein ACR2ID_09820 [Chthoniobacterales bacterium]
MIKRALLALLGCGSLCLPLAAQTSAQLEQFESEIISSDQLSTTGTVDTGSALSLYRSDLFSNIDGSILIHGLPVMTLLDGRRLHIAGELGRMGTAPLDIFPLAFLSAVAVQPHAARPRAGSGAPGGVVDLQLRRGWETGGEVGVFYGKSGGKYGREDMEAYIVGTVGTDKVQITAGAAYRESSGRFRYGR